MGGNQRLRAWRLHARDDAVAVRGDWRPARRDRRASVLDRARARAVGPPGARGPRRRTVAAELQEAAGGTAARAAVAPAHPEASADRGWACAAKRRCPRRARTVEDASPRRGRAP